jgi:hypothetical protein
VVATVVGWGAFPAGCAWRPGVSDTRSQIGDALAGKLTPDQLDYLMNEVLAITKRPWGEFNCKNCGQRQKQQVDIPDAKAVTGALTDLLNQAWGRPSEDKVDAEGIVFVRKVVFGGTEEAHESVAEPAP